MGGALGTRDLCGNAAAAARPVVVALRYGGDLRPPLAPKNAQKRMRPQVRNGRGSNIAIAPGPCAGILGQPRGMLSTAQPRVSGVRMFAALRWGLRDLGRDEY